MAEKKLKQVCHCDKCGNEAEMEITCQLLPEDEEGAVEKKDVKISNEKKEGAVPGHAVCKNCGSEADIWLDMSES